MKSKFRTILSACAGIAVLSLTVATAQNATPAPKAKLGEKAPTWTLTDADGTEHKLEDFKGKTVILEWYNPDCPYVVGIYEKGVPQKTWEKLQKMCDDYVYLLVNSTATGRGCVMPKYEVIERGVTFLKEHKFDVPMLVDYDGTVGKMYGARTTPHMFITDGEGVLRYQGAYTNDSNPKKTDPDAMNYVLNAVTQLMAGETVSPDYEKPWGCSVKYKD